MYRHEYMYTYKYMYMKQLPIPVTLSNKLLQNVYKDNFIKNL